LYGFVTTDEGKDVFLHFSSIVMEGYKTLRDGQEVEFEITKGEKGDQAVNVVPVPKKIELELEEKK
jgi:CspA family cold shock protein